MPASRRSLLLLAFALLAGCAGTASRDDPELVLVAGASGRAGHFVIAELADRGARFRSLTRDRDEAVARWGEAFADMNWVEGDVRDAARMRELMDGVSRVICVIGSRELSGPNSAEFVDYGGVRNLVDAAVAEGVAHFVLLTAIGVTDPAHPFNRATRGALQWRLKGEAHLRASGLVYTIVRPAGLVNRPAGEQGLRVGQGDDWKPFLASTLSREDLARVLVAALEVPAARNVTLELANDAELPPGGWDRVFDGLSPDSAAAGR